MNYQWYISRNLPFPAGLTTVGDLDLQGYARHWKQGMTMSQDWHVTYHRSKLHGRRVYYIRHSAIEYVFTND